MINMEFKISASLQNKTIALFVNVDGNGGVAEEETNNWVEFLKDNNISNSALKPGVSSDGEWLKRTL